MRTPRELYPTMTLICKCELEACPQCNGALVETAYLNGLKTVQTMSQVMKIAYRPKQCADVSCASSVGSLPSASWQQIAPKYSTYGYDVIAQIGWERQRGGQRFEQIHRKLAEHLQISEAQVRYLYQQRYLPLLVCHERQHLAELEKLARQSGLLLGLDGLMPVGGEPQLWVVRELQTGWTLRSGWMSCQTETAFIQFLQPIADLNLLVQAVMSDKQRGLLGAVATVFPTALHGFCQMHYLDNAAEPLAEADEQMKIALRQEVRTNTGDLIRQKQAEKPVILTVTGMIPTPSPASPTETQPVAERERESIVQDLLSRVRYLLTLKGRPPLRLAGIEMFARLQEVDTCIQELLRQQTEPRLQTLHAGLSQALHTFHPTYTELSQASHWLTDLADVLDPDNKPVRTGEQVRAEWETCLTRMDSQAQHASPRLQEFRAKIRKVSASYAPGLFHTYDIPGLPRTNNGRESEFRDVRRRLLVTTGQVGAVQRLLLRTGAWELISAPASQSETVTAISQVKQDQFLQERQRILTHRARFRLHSRSIKQSAAQLHNLIRRWKSIPTINSP